MILPATPSTTPSMSTWFVASPNQTSAAQDRKKRKPPKHMICVVVDNTRARTSRLTKVLQTHCYNSFAQIAGRRSFAVVLLSREENQQQSTYVPYHALHDCVRSFCCVAADAKAPFVDSSAARYRSLVAERKSVSAFWFRLHCSLVLANLYGRKQESTSREPVPLCTSHPSILAQSHLPRWKMQRSVSLGHQMAVRRV